MKKKSKEWLMEEAKLKTRAIILLMVSQKLKADAEQQYQAIVDFDLKYPDDMYDKMTWQQKEMIVQEAEAMSAKLDSITKDLEKLEVDYKALTEEMNTFYGKEVFKPLPPLASLEPEDPADWWKVS